VPVDDAPGIVVDEVDPLPILSASAGDMAEWEPEPPFFRWEELDLARGVAEAGGLEEVVNLVDEVDAI
jgi:hypothetical protein